ncbi:hypothetical protein V6Z12_D10G013300 [Gossypium hirsutum]|nr:hypothetical protein ES288_D10G013200v1 [Gossypium darwinii]
MHHFISTFPLSFLTATQHPAYIRHPPTILCPTTQQKKHCSVNPNLFSMAFFSTSFFTCFFSGSNKVASQGEDTQPSSSTVSKAGSDAKLKEGKAKNNPPIPITYFPIGSKLSLL